MRSNGFHRLFVAIAACAALTFAAASATPSVASAQCTGPACTPVRPDGKGIIGLGLIGGEIGLIIPAIIQNAAHTNEWWPYLVFPLIGIGAGIGGGYALEQATPNQPEIDVGILIGGMVLLIPAIVGTLALASYQPPAEAAPPDDDIDTGPTNTDGDSVEAVQDSSSTSAPPPSGSSSSSSSGAGPTSSLIGGPGLIRLDADTRSIGIGVPILGAIGRYSSEELAALHLVQQYDTNIPIVSATF